MTTISNQPSTCAAKNNAHLSVLVISFASPPPIGDYASTISDAWLEERQADIQQLEKRTAKITTLLSEAGISANISSEYAEFVWAAGEIGRHARYTDLIFIGPEVLKSEELKSKVLEGALFESGRPILIAPFRNDTDAKLRGMCFWRGIRAWNLPARPGRRWICSSKLRTFTSHWSIPDTSTTMNGPEPGADVGAYLAHHGVKVIVDRLPSGGNPVAEVLNQHAVDIAADLIVMGGYGHSRLRERVFGGVTKSMIDAPKFPILMAR